MKADLPFHNRTPGPWCGCLRPATRRSVRQEPTGPACVFPKHPLLREPPHQGCNPQLSTWIMVPERPGTRAAHRENAIRPASGEVA
jgi:hypothetical protein